MFAYFTQFHTNDCKMPKDLPILNCFTIKCSYVDDLAIHVETFFKIPLSGYRVIRFQMSKNMPKFAFEHGGFLQRQSQIM